MPNGGVGYNHASPKNTKKGNMRFLFYSYFCLYVFMFYDVLTEENEFAYFCLELCDIEISGGLSQVIKCLCLAVEGHCESPLM